MNNKSQSGRTMVEVLAVLSILGVLFTSVMMTVNSMYDKFKSSNIVTQIRDLRKGINNRVFNCFIRYSPTLAALLMRFSFSMILRTAIAAEQPK